MKEEQKIEVDVHTITGSTYYIELRETANNLQRKIYALEERNQDQKLQIIIYGVIAVIGVVISLLSDKVNL